MPSYRPPKLVSKALPPEGKPYGVEVYIPNKPTQSKGFDNFDDAKRYMAQVRQLQKSVQLYVRITFADWTRFYYPKTGRIQPVEHIKGHYFCPICGDYTRFSKKHNTTAYDSPACEYCGITTEDWHVKSFNGLWPNMTNKKHA